MKTSIETHMAEEIRSVPQVAKALLADGAEQAQAVGSMLAKLNPKIVTTIARGSSDHVASYLKYAIEISMGVPVASTGPSIASIYGSVLNLENAASFAISQSGKSPDILAMAKAAQEGGSQLISLTNVAGSPLSQLADHNINIGAGPELSVAATKTFVLSILSGLMIVANWSKDKTLLAALQKLPDEFERAIDCDWKPLARRIAAANDKQSLYVLGRGPSFAIAKECALKFKETCLLHAEAYSGAEVMHGPVSIAQQGFPVLALVSRDQSQTGMLDILGQMQDQGAGIFMTSDVVDIGTSLPYVRGSHALTDPLIQVLSFYVFIERLARQLGHNPDEPPHLLKETKTV